MKLVSITAVVLLLSLSLVSLVSAVAKTIPTEALHSLKVPTFDDLSTFEDDLSFSYYHNSCPDVERIIYNKVNEWFKKDYTLAAALIRLHFHDCAVRGCDASILLDHKGSERSASASKTLRGFEVINDIKAAIEKKCPKTVSCADILTAATRDATRLLKGPFWDVPFGRKDGRVSLAKEANKVPAGHESTTSLIEFFQSKGLNVIDLVVLSGAHTIGRSTCGSIQYRLYNYKGSGKPDSSINPKYLNYLIRKCRWVSEYVDLDGTTPRTFDTQFYKNLQNHTGLLSTDQNLYSDSRTSPLVNALTFQSELFNYQFSVAMVKLGNILEYSQANGEVRVDCRRVNGHVNGHVNKGHRY